METPFYYEYTDGWAALLQNISTYILILALVIGFFVSGIFLDEFQTKADSIFSQAGSWRPNFFCTGRKQSDVSIDKSDNDVV